MKHFFHIITSNAASTANTVAHEMGHNIGFGHYKCECTKAPCVMSAGKSENACKSFAPCTVELYNQKLAKGKPLVYYNHFLLSNILL